MTLACWGNDATRAHPMFPPRPLAEPAGLAGGAVTKRRRNPPVRPSVDVDALPDIYANLLLGNCLEPLIPDGASVVIKKSAPYTVGDVVCIWWRPEFVKPGMHPAWLKPIRLNAPHWVKFPYKDHPKSDVQAIIVLEQINPPMTYVRSDKLLPIGDGIVPQLGGR